MQCGVQCAQAHPQTRRADIIPYLQDLLHASSAYHASLQRLVDVIVEREADKSAAG